MARRALSLVDPDSDRSSPAHFAVGGSAISLGQAAAGVVHLEAAARLGGSAISLSVGTRPDIDSRAWAAHGHWLLGHLEEAEACCRDAIALARTVDHPYNLAVALGRAQQRGVGRLLVHGVPPRGVKRGAAQHRADKEARVRSDEAHAALVYDGDTCVGWCQFGSPAELPRIKHRRAYEQGAEKAPDWRITCFFVDTTSRRRGVAAAALDGALTLVAGQGGGTVESFSEDAENRKVSSSFLHNGTLALFESRGFQRVRPLGKNHWLVRTEVRGGAARIMVEDSGPPRVSNSPRSRR